jgi:uncharacterized phage protein (TIGR01671 family)
MNREIKFRAWDKKDKFFYYNDDLSFLRFDELPELLKEYNLELMQYTGLKDKNGKEIYEGDLLTYYSENCDKKFDGRKKAVVKWDNKKSGFSPFVEDSSICNCYCSLSDFEVIGNIYETGKLK